MKKRKSGSIFTIFVILSTLILSAAFAGSKIKRDVLALYYSDLRGARFLNPVFRYFEPAMSHLGLITHYHNFAQGLPDLAKNVHFRNIDKIIVSLDEDEIDDPMAFWKFIKHQLEQGKKVVLMNWQGPLSQKGYKNKDFTVEANRALALMGLRFDQEYSTILFDIDIAKADNSSNQTFADKKSFSSAPFTGYESPVKAPGLTFFQVTSTGTENRVLLRLRKRRTNSFSDSVVITPNGGIALSGSVFSLSSADERKKLKLNIYRFFEEAFKIKGQPRPDVGVINGRRVYFSHIDGDGFNSQTLYDPEKTCGQAMYDFFLKYHELPVSCSVITCEINTARYSLRDSAATARKIFSLPNIEPASHTHTHPLIWDRGIHPEGHAGEYAGDIDNADEKDYFTSYNVHGYSFSRKYEVQGAVEYINKELVAKDSPMKCTSVFWSGNCVPGRRSIEYAHEKGIHNINGGDSRFDSFFDSRIYLCPVLRIIEGSKAYQVWAAACNENIYTNLWTGPFYGFSNVVHTFEKTGYPDILKPIDVYYHHYSAERLSSLGALESIMSWARSKEIFKAFVSDYCRTVGGYRNVTFEKTAATTWKYTNAQGLETIRFDIPDENITLDIKNSKGVTGCRRINSSLYVFLDSALEAGGIVSLMEKAVSGTESNSENSVFSKPYLHESTSFIKNLTHAERGFEFDFSTERAGSTRKCVWCLPPTWTSVLIEPNEHTDFEVREGKLEISARGRKTLRIKVRNNS